MDSAYVTLIAGGDAYAPGIEALGRSLYATGSAVPRVLLATPDVPERTLDHLADDGWRVRRVEPLANPAPPAELLFARFANTYTKLRAFGLEDVGKAVFLDADTLVLRNIDELFDRPDFAAASDFFVPDRFNSGVMVFAPSRARFAALEAALRAAKTYDGGDQGFLNSVLPEWWSLDAAHRLPSMFNVHHFVFQFMSAHASLRRQFLADVRVVHYTLQKPWLTPTFTGGAGLWWETYAALHPERDGAWHHRLHAAEDWTFDHVVRAISGD